MHAKLRKLFAFCSKRYVLLSALFITSLVAFAYSATVQFKTVTVSADGKTFTTNTFAESAETLLTKKGITLFEGDEVEPAYLEDGVTLTVKRSFPVKITLGTDSFTVKTVSKPLSAVLEKEGIVLGEHDIVTPVLTTVVTPHTEITITRVRITEERVTEEIPFARKFRENPTLNRNETKVVTTGENGRREALYRMTFTNGEKTAQELVSEKVTKPAVTEIIEYGAEETQPMREKATAETVSVLASCEYIDCKAYSYIIHGKTATGMKTKRGLIAVDPKVIPLGSKVYVQSLDGKADYGYAVAADTGGMIKGKTIDMWVPTYAEAAQNGVRKMRVYILPQ